MTTAARASRGVFLSTPTRPTAWSAGPTANRRSPQGFTAPSPSLPTRHSRSGTPSTSRATPLWLPPPTSASALVVAQRSTSRATSTKSESTTRCSTRTRFAPPRSSGRLWATPSPGTTPTTTGARPIGPLSRPVARHTPTPTPSRPSSTAIASSWMGTTTPTPSRSAARAR